MAIIAAAIIGGSAVALFGNTRSSIPVPRPSSLPESNMAPADKTTGTLKSTDSAEEDKDCTDFVTHAEAQVFFESAGPGDPHRLDKDGDGIACETLP